MKSDGTDGLNVSMNEIYLFLLDIKIIDEMSSKFVVLKPFDNENDENRDYDILRSVILCKKMEKRKNMTNRQRSNLLRYCRTDLRTISQMKKKYPVISSKTVEKIAAENDAKFFFWTQQNTREKLKLVTQIGRGRSVINLKLPGFETFYEISFKKLTLLLDLINNKIYPSLTTKIAKFSSIAHVVSHFTGKDITETEFLDQWGDHEIHFQEEEKFIELFGIGLSFWSDDSECERLRGSWAENHIPILLCRRRYRYLKIDIHEELSVVIDKKYLKDFRCQFCFAKFTKRQNCSRWVLNLRNIGIISIRGNFISVTLVSVELHHFKFFS